nr:HNH endonuclease signature motif containing protein [Bacillus subtilis]
MRYCIFNGCAGLAITGSYYCEEHKPKAKGKGRDTFQSKNKPFYRSDDWQSMRQYVFERDGAKCRECGQFVFGKNAHVHHVIAIAEDPTLKLEESNLILLCPKCHAKIENENKKQTPRVFQKYFKHSGDRSGGGTHTPK